MGVDLRRFRVTDIDKLVRPYETGTIKDLELIQLALPLLEETPETRAGFAAHGGPHDPERQLMADIISEMVESAPAGYIWTCHDHARTYSTLFWVLTKISKGPEWTDAERAVYGHNYLTLRTPDGFTTARGVCGGALKVVNPSETGRTFEFLNGIGRDALTAAADPHEMLGEPIYKSRECQRDDPRYELVRAELQAQIVADFENLKSFYGEISATQDSAIVIVD